jgi:hypothetical protein
MASKGYFWAPAICMTTDDHKKTASYGGNRHTSKGVYRGTQAFQISFGPIGFDAAQSRDIADVRGRFGSKYDFGIIQMRNYTRLLQSQRPDLFRL